MGPGRTGLSQGLRGSLRVQHHRVVVALEDYGPLLGEAAHPADHLARLGPIAHQVTEDGVAPHPGSPRMREAGLERAQVGMDV